MAERCSRSIQVYTAYDRHLQSLRSFFGVTYASSIAAPVGSPVSPLVANDQGPRTPLCLSTGESSGLAALEQIFHRWYHLRACLAGQWGSLRWQESKIEEVLFGLACYTSHGAQLDFSQTRSGTRSPQGDGLVGAVSLQV